MDHRINEQNLAIIRDYLNGVKRNDIRVEVVPEECYEYAGIEDSGAFQLDNWCNIAPGTMLIDSINGKVEVDAWYVYAYKTIYGGRWEPDDCCTETLFESRSFSAAVKNAICGILHNEMNAVDDNHYAEEYC